MTGVDLSSAEPGLLSWLANGFHGDMAYMAAHGLKRARPAELVPGTVSVLTARMDYLPRFTSHATHAATDAASDGDWTELNCSGCNMLTKQSFLSMPEDVITTR